jgi:hypothetical protein
VESAAALAQVLVATGPRMWAFPGLVPDLRLMCSIQRP